MTTADQPADFAVGDTVEVIADVFYLIPVGTLAVIAQVKSMKSPDKRGPFYLLEDQPPAHFYADELRKVTP